MKKNKKIAVLIPCYNESKTIKKVIYQTIKKVIYQTIKKVIVTSSKTYSAARTVFL